MISATESACPWPISAAKKPARHEEPRQIGGDRAICRQPVRAAIERPARIVVAHFRRQPGDIGRRDIGRVGDHGVESSRPPPAPQSPATKDGALRRGRAAPRCAVLLSQRRRDIDADAACLAVFGEERQQADSRCRCRDRETGTAASRSRQPAQHGFDDRLGLGARVERVGDSTKFETPEFAPPTMRLSGSRASTRRAIAAIRACCFAVQQAFRDARTPRPGTAPSAAASSRRACRRGSSIPPPPARQRHASERRSPTSRPHPLAAGPARLPPPQAGEGPIGRDRFVLTPSPAGGGGLGGGLPKNACRGGAARLGRGHRELRGAVGGGQRIDDLVERLARQTLSIL